MVWLYYVEICLLLSNDCVVFHWIDVPLFNWPYLYICGLLLCFDISKQCFGKHPCAFIFAPRCEHVCETNSLINLFNEYLLRAFCVPSTFLRAKNATDSLKVKLLTQSINILILIDIPKQSSKKTLSTDFCSDQQVLEFLFLISLPR